MIILSDKTETILSGGHQKQHEWVCSIRTTSTNVQSDKVKKKPAVTAIIMSNKMSTLRFLRRLAGQLKGWPYTDEYTDSHLFTSPHLNYCLLLTSSSLFIYLKDSEHIVLLYVSF